MSTERILKLLEKREGLNKEINKKYEEIEVLKEAIHNLYGEIEKVDIVIFQREKSYL